MPRRPSRLPPPPKNAGETGGLRQQCDCSGERSGNRTGEDVTIPHMPQLVGEHAFQFLVVEQIENTLGDRHGGMLGVASGSKCVGRIAGDDIDLRHRQRHARQDALHDLVDPRQLLARDRLRAIHRQRQLVGIEIAEEVHPGSDEESQDHSIAAAKVSANEDEKQGESSQQKRQFSRYS